MKTIARTIAIYTFTLYILQFIIPGVKISGGLPTLFIGGIALSALFLIIKPILNFLSFPANALTLGLFSLFTNGLLLYLLTAFVSGIAIMPFSYEHAEIGGFILPTIEFNGLFAYVYSAFVLSFIESFLSWLMK